ncbi:beta-ketoacyl synthase chain length factor [Falsiroseomonas sp. E2-1-a20]|uniref:beta-ketoacyl synthase chain length factor n=1 Tax=Falsiroseomonas sp. E2-1-a20 TaxID=3239300 RepID=UPI003F2C42D2
MKCFLGAVSVFGPGLPGWAASRAILAGTQPWAMAEALPPAPAIVAPGDRRRAGATTRFALAAASEATEAEPDRAALETFFASGNGDGAVVGGILDALHDAQGVVSPTQFHNSVHNAAAGYWHIAVGSTMPSVSLGGHDGAFAAGLLAAMGAVATRGRAVLLVAYDTPMTAPLSGVRTTAFPFATACLLRPAAEGAQAMLELRYVAEPAPETTPADALDALAPGNPAARALPLLRAVAAGRPAQIRLPLLPDAHLDLRVTPC